MAPDEDNGNGRVTLAVLGTKIDTVIEQLRVIAECQQRDHDRLGKLESTAESNLRRINDLEGTRKALSWESRIESLIVAALATWGIIKT